MQRWFPGLTLWLAGEGEGNPEEWIFRDFDLSLRSVDDDFAAAEAAYSVAGDLSQTGPACAQDDEAGVEPQAVDICGHGFASVLVAIESEEGGEGVGIVYNSVSGEVQDGRFG